MALSIFPGYTGYNDPYSEASDTLNEIPSTLEQTYNPYISAGYQSLNALGTQSSNLINNNYNNLQASLTQMLLHPESILSELGANYQESPGYQFEMQQGLDAANNAAAAGGTLGTPQNEQFDEQTAENIANQNYEEYIKNALKVGKAGLKGTGELYQGGLRGVKDISHQGFNASNQLAQGLAQYLTSLANLQYASTVSNNEHSRNLLTDSLFAGLLAGALI